MSTYADKIAHILSALPLEVPVRTARTKIHYGKTVVLLPNYTFNKYCTYYFFSTRQSHIFALATPAHVKESPYANEFVVEDTLLSGGWTLIDQSIDFETVYQIARGPRPRMWLCLLYDQYFKGHVLDEPCLLFQICWQMLQ